MAEWSWLIIGLLGGLVLREFLPSYLREKGKNIATKEDLREITRIAEEIKTENQLLLEKTKPLTAEATLRRQNLLNSKLECYREACDVVCRGLASRSWTGETVPDTRQPSTDVPSEREINACAATLALFTCDVRVRNAFLKCFQETSPADLGMFVSLLREDLGYGQSVFRPEEYPYIFGEAGQSLLAGAAAQSAIAADGAPPRR